jgi:hypothetical protein
MFILCFVTLPGNRAKSSMCLQTTCCVVPHGCMPDATKGSGNFKCYTGEQSNAAGIPEARFDCLCVVML